MFAQILPVYLALNYAPMLALRFNSFIRNPWKMGKKAAVNAARSSVFLGVFVSSYMYAACVHRNLVLATNYAFEHKLLYFLFGMISSVSIFLEHKSRRSELALYVLPKGLAALYSNMYNRKLLLHIPHFEVGMFSVGMGCILAFFETEHECLSTFVYRLLYRCNEAIEDKKITERNLIP